MLTIFSHLALSVLDQLPAGRQPIKTWVVPERKRLASYQWIQKHLQANPNHTVLVVCPFIDPSHHQALENVASVEETTKEFKTHFPDLVIGQLHGRQKAKTKEAVIDQLYQHQLDMLVTTPVIEVGVDVSSASIMLIEAAERFGLASLHQLRGRVGRAGQQAYCLLFTNSKNKETKDRLATFAVTTNGLELAELDLQRRGAGELFGTIQHGFDQLRFADWTDLELLNLARQTFHQLSLEQKDWQSPFTAFRYGADLQKTNPLAN